MGRPSKYESAVEPYLDDIKKWTAAGATVEEIADALGVNARTLREYARKYPAFNSAITRGRKEVIINIKAALLKKATGFTYEEKRQSIKSEPDKDGSPKKVMYTEIYTRYCVPSETAAVILLRNLDPDYKDSDDATIKLKQQEAELRRRIAESKEWLDGESEG